MECCIGSVIFFGLVAFLTIFVAYGRELGKEQERERKYGKARRKELEKEKETIPPPAFSSGNSYLYLGKPYYSSRPSKPTCTHDNPILCSRCNECIECNGGHGDTSTPEEPLCHIHGYYDSGDDE